MIKSTRCRRNGVVVGPLVSGFVFQSGEAEGWEFPSALGFISPLASFVFLP